MSPNEIAEQIETWFLMNEITWTIDGVQTAPTVEDIAQVIEELLAYPTKLKNPILERGKLLIKRSEGRTDLYVHVTEIKEKNEESR